MTFPETSQTSTMISSRSGRALAAARRIGRYLDIPRTDRRARTSPRPVKQPYVRVTMVSPAGCDAYSGPCDDPHMIELWLRGWTVRSSEVVRPGPTAVSR